MRNLTRNFCMVAALLTASDSFAATPRQLQDFYLAAQLNDPGSVRDLLKVIGNPNGRDPISGETAMILALREESERVLPVLLADPAIDLEATAVNGNTALMMAAFKSNAAAVKLLIAKGARVNRTGWNALHYAAAAGSADIVRILVEHKADINAPSPSGLTALMLAAREGQESAVQALLALGADTTLKNNENLDAAQIARRADKERIVEMIQGRGAAP
jgi:ankyrin repeat protein